MTEDQKLLPILEYIHKNYLADATEPGGESKAKVGELAAEVEKRKGKREEVIQYLRSLTPFQHHILDAGKELHKINRELAEALEKSDADKITRGYFRVAGLLISLKLWRHTDLPIEKLEKTLEFAPEEIAFLDHLMGMDAPLITPPPETPDPIVTLRTANVDKYELWEKDKLLNPDYAEPLRVKIREYIHENYHIQRIDHFSGTRKPLPPNQSVKPVRVQEEVPDITYFHRPSQFLRHKFAQLRNSTYKALAVERHETGGYRERRIQLNLEGDKLVEVQKGMISAAIHFLTPNTIWQKMVEDVKLLQQTLTMGAKKIDKDYFFNIFYHIQTPIGLDRSEESAGPAGREQFDPTKETDPFKHRDRITAEMASQLIRELSKCDQYVFGGHLDLDLYLDGIGIRKKPNVLMIEGEGLGSYDYINNLIILPTICPPKVTPLDQVVSALGDFRYSLWIDTPKEIFDKQGVGFMVIGRKTSATKALWQIFPSHATALLKQRAFREYYVRHIFSNLFSQGVRVVAGCEVPITNRIADQKLRQYFEAYIPLAEIKSTGTPEVPHPEHEELKEEPPPEAPAEAQPPAPPAPAAPPKPTTPTPPPPHAPTHAETLCSNCGKPMPPGSKFCLECGTTVGAAAKCKSCGADLPSGSKFCNECGAKQ